MSMTGALRQLNQQRRMRRMRRVVIRTADAAREVAELGGFRVQALLVTLTYADGALWRSRDVAQYIHRTRKWLNRRAIRASYQWVIELTKRGRPHYHVLWWVPVDTRLPMPDRSGHWEHGLSRIEAAYKPVGYLVKYATKGDIEAGQMPRGARLFGAGSSDEAIRHARHRAGLPAWLHDATGDDVKVSRVRRVGWTERETGLIHSSPFSVEFTKDDWGFVLVVVTKRD